MRTQVKQTDRTILVRAVADDGHVVGALKATKTYTAYFDESRYEAWNEAAELCLSGYHDSAQEVLAEVEKASRCLEAVDKVQHASNWNEELFVLESVKLRGRNRREDLDAALKMYRAAAISAGRRKTPFVAEACGSLAVVPEHIPEGLSAWVWKQPEFRRDMEIVGPVAMYRAQLALGPGRAANRRRLCRVG